MEKHWWDNAKTWKWWISFIIIVILLVIFGLIGLFVGILIFALYFYFTGQKEKAKSLMGTKKEWTILIVIFALLLLFVLIMFFIL